MVVSVSLSMPGRTLLARPGRQSKIYLIKIKILFIANSHYDYSDESAVPDQDFHSENLAM